MLPFTVHPVGDSALLAVFTQRIAPEIGAAVAALNTRVLSANISGVDETVPAFASLMVTYDPLVTDSDAVATAMQKLADVPDADSTAENGKLVTIPVCYGGEYGPDLAYVAEYCHLTEEEVVKIHSSGEYLCYMIGFCPGFPFLGGMDPRIATPRRQTPRLAIPARSIGIAGQQTGGYPISTPGGWQIIGRSAIEMFDASAENPTLLKAGDIVHFRSITPEEYAEMRGDAK